MTIKEIEERLGITRANIRFYEKEGLFITKRNPLNGYREYTEETVTTLEKIMFLRNLDVPIEQIRLLQSGNILMEDLLTDHIHYLKEKEEEFHGAARICQNLLENQEFDYQKLQPEKYQNPAGERDDIQLKDALGLLAGMKAEILLIVMIIISVISAVTAYPLMPAQVPVQWLYEGADATAGRWIIFLFPLVCVMIPLFTKVLVWNALYLHVPYYLFYVDKIASFVSVYSLFAVLTCQFYIILDKSGSADHIGRVLTAELIVCLVSAGITARKRLPHT